MNESKKNDFALTASHPGAVRTAGVGVRYLMALACLLAASSCGTLNTVARGDEVAAKKLTNMHTHCKTIPRVYSGVSYNFCSLHGEPAPYNSGQNSAGGFYFIFFDAMLSGIFDTLVLPYTIVRQLDDGNITIHKPMY